MTGRFWMKTDNYTSLCYLGPNSPRSALCCQSILPGVLLYYYFIFIFFKSVVIFQSNIISTRSGGQHTKELAYTSSFWCWISNWPSRPLHKNVWWLFLRAQQGIHPSSACRWNLPLISDKQHCSGFLFADFSWLFIQHSSTTIIIYLIIYT